MTKRSQNFNPKHRLIDGLENIIHVPVIFKKCTSQWKTDSTLGWKLGKRNSKKLGSGIVLISGKTN